MKYFKEGQTVYHPIYGEGVVYRINEFEEYPIVVEFENYKITFTTDGRHILDKPISLSQNTSLVIANKPFVDNYIHFTFEDRELLRGQWVRKKRSKEEESMIIYIGEHKVETDGNYYTYQYLFEDFEFINGKPCGKLI